MREEFWFRLLFGQRQTRSDNEIGAVRGDVGDTACHPAVDQCAVIERPDAKAILGKQGGDAVEFSLEKLVVNADIANQRLHAAEKVFQPAIALHPFGVERHQPVDFRSDFGTMLHDAAVEGMQDNALADIAGADDFDGLFHQVFIGFAVRAGFKLDIEFQVGACGQHVEHFLEGRNMVFGDGALFVFQAHGATARIVEIADMAACGRSAVERCIVDDQYLAGIGQVQVEFHALDVQRQNIAKAGERVFGPQIARAAMGHDHCHLGFPY